MKKKNKILLEEHFKSLNTSVTSWITFGEAKNAAIVVFNTAIFTALFTQNSIQTKCFVFVCFLLLIFATIVSLISFFPNLASFKNNKNHIKVDLRKMNLCFFKDISYFDNVKQFINETLLRYFPNIVEEYNESDEFKKINDLASEVFVNSIICRTKYTLFRISLIIDFFVLISLAVIFAINYLHK